MLKRRRFKHTNSLSDRLMQDVEHLQKLLATVKPGQERDDIIRRIRRNETASHIEEWLRSPGLQPPTGATR